MINRAIQIAILALLVALPASAQVRKFRPAPPGAKGVRADEWIVSFDKKFSPEEFERELGRVLKQYGAKLRPVEVVRAQTRTFVQDIEIPSKNIDSRSAILKVSKAGARRIARDRVVIEVYQAHALEAAG